MPSIYFIYGSPLSGKTKKIMEIMKQKHEIDPLSYTFIGPSGYYVREFADKFIEHVGSIVRGNFYVIDQFAVEIFREFEPQMLHISEEFEKVILSKIIENMNLDNSVKKSTNFVDDLLEVIRDIKEKGEDYLEKLPEADIYSIVIEAYIRLKDEMLKMKLFDSFDAYSYLSKLDLPNGFKGRYLFMDGFYDFTPIMKRMLKKIFRSYDEIYLTCTIDNRKIFSRTRTIVDFLEELGEDFTIIKQRLQPGNLEKIPEERKSFLMNVFSDSANNIKTKFAEVEKYPNRHFEVENLCKIVKRLISNGKYEPGDIAIVLNDFQGYKTLFTRKMENYGIPYRLEGDLKLSESFVVNLLLLPLDTIVKGYPPEMIMSMVDFGYFNGIDPVEFESIFLRSRVIALPRKRFRAKDRKEEILEKLNRYQEKIRNELEHGKLEEEFSESVIEELEDEYLRVNKVKEGIKKIFEDFLEPLSSKSIKIEKYKVLFSEWVKKLDLEEKLRASFQIDQLIALKNFFLTLDELEIILKSINKKRLSVYDYRKYLSIITSSVTYKPSLDFDNRVEFLSLEASRFKTKRLKIYTGFNDGIYPRVYSNLFYSGNSFSEILGTRYYDLKEQQQKLDLFISMSKTTDKVLFTYPTATIEGEPLLPSPFYFDMFPVDYEAKEAVIINEPSSVSELKTQYVLSNYPENRFINIEEKIGLKAIIDDFSERISEDVHQIKDRDLMRSLVGNRLSYSKLSTFNRCGIKFYFKYVLGISEKFEKRFGFTPLEKGLIYHSTLTKLFKYLKKTGQKLYLAYKNIEFKEKLYAILKEEIEKYIYYDSEIIKKIEFEYFKDYLEKLIEKMVKTDIYHLKDGEYYDFVPEHFEISFGISEDYKVVIRNRDLNIELVGRIDRLDVFEREKLLFIIDYKTKDTNARDQLIFYTFALQKLKKFMKYKIFGGCVIVIEDPKISSRFSLDEFGTIKFERGRVKNIGLQQFEKELLQTAEKIYEGNFNNEKTNCYGCYFKDLCIFLR